MKFLKIWKELNKERSISEINTLISEKLIEKVCIVFMSMLVLMPIIICITNIFNDKELYWLYNWYQYNLSIGMLGIVVGLILFVRYLVNDSRRPLKKVIEDNKVKTLLLLLFIWSVVSFVCSTNHKISFFGDFYRREGLLCYIGYVGIFILASQIKEFKKQRIVLELMVGAASLLALICFINNQHLLELLRLNNSSGIFYNQNHYGYYLVICIIAAQLLFINGQNKYLSILHLLELAVLINALINAGSMGPLLAVAIASIAYLIILVLKNKSCIKKGLLIVVVCLISGTLSSVNTWNLHEDVTTMIKDASTLTTTNISTSKELEAFDSVGSARGKLWRYGLQFVMERPLTGYGPDNLGERYLQVGCNNDRAHNELVQMTASLGIPALCFYISALLILLLRFFKYFKSIDSYELGIYCCLGGYLISSFFGNTTFYTTPFYLLILGFTVNNSKLLSSIYHKTITK